MIIEAAIAVPILFFTLLGLIDIGLAMLQTSQATSAAADGARAGVIWRPDQDMRTKIEAAVRRRLPGQATEPIEISCISPDGSPFGTGLAGCNLASTKQPQLYRVKVKVRWKWEPLTPIGKGLPIQYVSSEVRMVLVSQPRSSP
ncbi:MAG: TadE family protein [Aquihabitans sp.]